MIGYSIATPYGVWAHPSTTKHFDNSNDRADPSTTWLDAFTPIFKLSPDMSMHKSKVGMEE
jgi:hypothetical protein